MGKSKRLFILAHPDDEIMALPIILDRNYINFFIYLTLDSKDSRYGEAKRAVQFLNKNRFNSELIDNFSPSLDGFTYMNLSRTSVDRISKSTEFIQPDEIVSTHYEGGHQDHDTAFIISFIIAKNANLPFLSFSTYRKSKNFLPFFNTMTSLENSHQAKFHALKTVYVALRMMLIYKSQWKTWIGLGPFVLLKYAKGTSDSQKYTSSLKDITFDKALYESRNRAELKAVAKNHSRLLESFLISE
jgi:LmbE family N-acetylglucosaminyl deacetylase